MDIRTWSPFQSQIAKDICSHMTKEEKWAAVGYGLASGLIVAVFFAIPISLGSTLLRSSITGLTGVAVLAWLILGVFVMLHWRAWGKRLLCATAWAKSQGITEDKL